MKTQEGSSKCNSKDCGPYCRAMGRAQQFVLWLYMFNSKVIGNSKLRHSKVCALLSSPVTLVTYDTQVLEI